MIKIIPFIVLLTISVISAQTTLSGNISGKTFKPSGNPYVVTENITITGNKPTIIKPGCIFLFKPFTEMEVQGPLFVTGTPDTPVVFTSFSDDQYNQESVQLPNPFDWNGIIVRNVASDIKFTDVQIAYSVFGIKSKKEDIIIERGVFRQNGQYHFTINGRIIPVQDNITFNYGKKNHPTATVKPRWIKPVAIALVTTGTSALCAGGYFFYNADQYDKKYHDDVQPLDIAHYVRKHDRYVRYAIAGTIIGGVLLPAGAGLLLFNPDTEKKSEKVTIYPTIGITNGLMVGFLF